MSVPSDQDPVTAARVWGVLVLLGIGIIYGCGSAIRFPLLTAIVVSVAGLTVGVLTACETAILLLQRRAQCATPADYPLTEITDYLTRVLAPISDPRRRVRIAQEVEWLSVCALEEPRAQGIVSTLVVLNTFATILCVKLIGLLMFSDNYLIEAIISLFVTTLSFVIVGKIWAKQLAVRWPVPILRFFLGVLKRVDSVRYIGSALLAPVRCLTR